MSITMQGPWTVQVKSKSAAFAQRFVIFGSDNADGVYDGVVGNPPVDVIGAQWAITIEHNPIGPGPWKPSAERVTNPVRAAGKISFDILSNDTGGDKDYNDLVLSCSIPESDSEFVLYGNVSTYSGLCFLNPCFRFPWVVIDTLENLREALKHEVLRASIEKLYPHLVRKPKPFPEPDPPPFRPIMIPLAAEQPAAAMQEARFVEDAPGKTRAAALETTAALQTNFSISRSAAIDIGKIRDRLRPRCTVEARPGILLRFLEYDRTAAELAGGPYTGDGDRQLLGLAVTDELGNYVFRFTRSLEDIAEEVGDVAPGETLATALRPDILVQIVGGTGSGTSPLFETALYTDIPNLRRINICIPESSINPGPAACQGGRAIQSIGNIFTLAGVGNTLDAFGRITSTHPSGPLITRAAWVGTLDMFACFLDLPNVTHYTVRYRRPPFFLSPGTPWQFVQEQYFHIYIPAIGFPNSPQHKVGPFTVNLHVDGGAAQPAPAYKNIENDAQWVATHRLRKVKLTSALYAAAVHAAGAGTVEFWIEGYDAAGNKVAAADDRIKLYIDNRPPTGDLASISLVGPPPGECALFEIPTANAALTARFKVVQPGGFLQSYVLSVYRGSSTPVAVADLTPPPQPLSLSYVEATYGDYFYGTANAVAPDADDYVLAELQPVAGDWLPAGKNFCAFSFSLTATPRVTDGYNTGTARWLDAELIGITYNPPPGP